MTWLKQPVVLRGISAHSDPRVSIFGPTAAVSALEASVGGHPWNGVYDPAQQMLVPSLAGIAEGRMEIHRTIFENEVLAGAGQRFYVHNGCQVDFPANVNQTPYWGESYAEYQNGESLLFFTNGLGLLARSKVFYDEPEGAMDLVAQTHRFGDALPGYFAAEAARTTLTPGGATDWANHRWRTLGRKKAYYWNVIGDFTLRLRY